MALERLRKEENHYLLLTVIVLDNPSVWNLPKARSKHGQPIKLGELGRSFLPVTRAGEAGKVGGAGGGRGRIFTGGHFWQLVLVAQEKSEF
jgi:hypothetical protein